MSSETIVIEEGSSLWKDAWSRLKKNKASMVSFWILVVILVLCFILPLFSFIIKPPNAINLENVSADPTLEHIFGTDHLGRDLFSRVLYGGRVSLLVGFVATSVAVIIGLIYGAVSGYAGGKIDDLMMRGVDTVSYTHLTLPTIYSV